MASSPDEPWRFPKQNELLCQDEVTSRADNKLERLFKRARVAFNSGDPASYNILFCDAKSGLFLLVQITTKKRDDYRGGDQQGCGNLGPRKNISNIEIIRRLLTAQVYKQYETTLFVNDKRLGDTEIAKKYPTARFTKILLQAG
jgi:hypothetical protein